ncbi:MAG: hypothetical protein RBT59_03210 [Arcobacteraceae bacterium]|jgi:transposase|nr:hypothetical protein [Arcobacteraceae bacterium]
MNDKQQKFILLRADGKSFDAIAKDLKVSKSQLIQWSKLLENEIKELQFDNLIKIKEAYSNSKVKRYEALLKQLDFIESGILEADLTKATIKDLFTIKNDIINQLDRFEKSISVNAMVTTTNEFGYKEDLSLRLIEV